MDLHAKSFTAFPHSGHIGRGLAHSMHLHEKRCIKRAGVAGIALRAAPYVIKNHTLTQIYCSTFFIAYNFLFLRYFKLFFFRGFSGLIYW